MKKALLIATTLMAFGLTTHAEITQFKLKDNFVAKKP